MLTLAEYRRSNLPKPRKARKKCYERVKKHPEMKEPCFCGGCEKHSNWASGMKPKATRIRVEPLENDPQSKVKS